MSSSRRRRFGMSEKWRRTDNSPLKEKQQQQRNQFMPEVPIVYWRDIQHRSSVGKAGADHKRPLPERFEQGPSAAPR